MTGTAGLLTPAAPVHGSWTGAAAQHLERSFDQHFGGPPDGVWAAPAVLPLLGALEPGAGAALLAAVDEWALVAVRRHRDGRVDVLAADGAPAASRFLAAAARRAAVRLAVRELGADGVGEPLAAAELAACVASPGSGAAVAGEGRCPVPVELGPLEPELCLLLLDSGQYDVHPAPGRQRVLGDLAARRDGDERAHPSGDRHRRHAGAEEARVSAAVRAIAARDLHALGGLMTASHSSARVHLRLSSVQVEATVGAVLRAGGIGARLAVPAFWGPVLALAPAARADDVVAAAQESAACLGFPVPRASRLRLGGGAGRVR